MGSTMRKSILSAILILAFIVAQIFFTPGIVALFILVALVVSASLIKLLGTRAPLFLLTLTGFLVVFANVAVLMALSGFLLGEAGSFSVGIVVGGLFVTCALPAYIQDPTLF